FLSGLERSSFKEFAVIRRTRSEDEIGENARQRDQSKGSRKRREIGITQPENQRPERQKNSKSPPNAHPKSRANKKDSADENADQPNREKNQGGHAHDLSSRSASSGVTNLLCARFLLAKMNVSRPVAPGSADSRVCRHSGAHRQRSCR